MLTDVFSPCLVRLKIFQVYRSLARYIYSGQGGYVRACDARKGCFQRTGAVPLRYRHAHRRTDTWPVARQTHVEGTAKARRQYVERAFAVRFSACDSVRRRHGGHKGRALPVRWMQNHFQAPISRRTCRIWDVTPPQHQTRKSRSTYDGLWPRHKTCFVLVLSMLSMVLHPWINMLRYKPWMKFLTESCM